MDTKSFTTHVTTPHFIEEKANALRGGSEMTRGSNPCRNDKKPKLTRTLKPGENAHEHIAELLEAIEREEGVEETQSGDHLGESRVASTVMEDCTLARGEVFQHWLTAEKGPAGC